MGMGMGMGDAEAGHILTHLSSGIHGPPGSSPYTGNHQLTPSSSALSPPASQPTNQSAAKRSRSRPTKSCEECRRKKLKCDRELPCANCKKGGRDGSICFYKSAPDERNEKRARVEDGERERERRPYGGVGYGTDRGAEGYYPTDPAPAPARRDVGPGRGILAYGISDVGSDTRGGSGESGYASDPKRRYQGNVGFGADVEAGVRGDRIADRYPNVAAIAREDNIEFGRGMFTYGVNDVPASETRNDLPTPMSSGFLAQDHSSRALGRVHVKGTRSRYVGLGDRMAMLDHVSVFSEVQEYIANAHSLMTLKTSL